ncbi:MAG: acetylornithine aminotransferase [Phylliscum demangeonii]|nr:MAG: acetylornithine aminotransferase [Phylliscum demangeonii]
MAMPLPALRACHMAVKARPFCLVGAGLRDRRRHASEAANSRPAVEQWVEIVNVDEVDRSTRRLTGMPDQNNSDQAPHDPLAPSSSFVPQGGQRSGKSSSSSLVSTYAQPPPIFIRGKGSYLWDRSGMTYLDFTSGISVNSLGHCDVDVCKAMAKQCRVLMHSSNVYQNARAMEFSQELVAKTRESGGMRDAAKVFISNSGTEANEAAIKFARKVGKTLHADGSKHEIVSFHNSFHGRTMGALSATPNAKYQAPFEPLVPGFRVGTFNDVDGLESLITDATCGVIVEPIQGEGGVNVATAAFLVALRQRCTAVGAVLIYDEIQCGLSRTGKLWAHQVIFAPDADVDGDPTRAPQPRPPSSASASASADPASDPEPLAPAPADEQAPAPDPVEPAPPPDQAAPHPDILTTAKALGNGFPIGATIVTDAIADAIAAGDHGTTFGGNPLACAVALHVLGRLADPQLQADVRAKAQLCQHYLKHLRRAFPALVVEVRGRGLLLGVQLTRDPGPVVAAARDHGLLILTCGTNTLRLLPSLNIPYSDLHDAFMLLWRAMSDVLEPGPDRADAWRHYGRTGAS